MIISNSYSSATPMFAYADTSFCDMKGHYSIVLYFTGCNLECPYCFNYDVCKGIPILSPNDIKTKFNELFTLFPNLGVVFSGGEPMFNIKKFLTAYAHFNNSQRKIGIHTNGLKVPANSLYFDAVIIGIKSRLEIPTEYCFYQEKIKEACIYYQHAEKKELRMVDLPQSRKDYKDTINFLTEHGVLSGWEINYVEPQ